MKITTELLQEMYNRHWRQTTYRGATYFKRKIVFEKMAKELNQASRVELQVREPDTEPTRCLKVEVSN